MTFLEHGAKGVVCVDWSPKFLNETMKILTEALGAQEVSSRVRAVRADVGSEVEVKRAVDICCQDFGGIDVMFANAGVSG